MFKCLLALIAGALLPISFAPFNVYTFAFISIALLNYLWLDASAKQAGLYGLLFGITCFGIGCSWVDVSIHQFGNVMSWLAAFITFLFVFILALFPATLGLTMNRLFKNKSDSIRCLVIFPALWVVWELLRSWLFSGFPWLLLGYSQLTTPLRGLAPIVGVYGISWAVAFIGAGLSLLARRNSNLTKGCCVSVIALIVVLGWGFNKHQWTKPINKHLTISLVQGNIASTMKWDNQKLLNVIDRYRSLTQKNWSSDLIIWPEAAIPAFSFEMKPLIEQLHAEALKNNSTIVTGIPIADSDQKQYNGLIVIGKHEQRYLKRHLVPFGEYMPFRGLLAPILKDFIIPMSDFSAGPSQQNPLLINGVTIAPFICYETAFPIMTLKSMLNTNMGLVILDDGWFGKSIALNQQMQMSQMRALETSRPLVVAANTGITGFINARGQLLSAAPIDTETVLTHSVQPVTGNTPLMRWGYNPLFGFLIILLVIGGCSRRKQNT
jgi:apolipoprotein N-acyltransferase